MFKYVFMSLVSTVPAEEWLWLEVSCEANETEDGSIEYLLESGPVYVRRPRWDDPELWDDREATSDSVELTPDPQTMYNVISNWPCVPEGERTLRILQTLIDATKQQHE